MNRTIARPVAVVALVLILAGSAHPQISAGDKELRKTPYTVSLVAEYGFLSVLEHQIQFSRSGTYFSYPEDGAQDVLFPVGRYSVNAGMGHHRLVLLYQPLRLETTELLERDLVIDNLLFPQGTPVKFLYDFPFFRASYLYDFTSNKGPFDIAAGLSLQIRDATIGFETLDGELYRTNRDVGPVPALKVYGSYRINKYAWVAAEADGIYAPVSYLNGDDNDVTGAILDASVRAGVQAPGPYDLFLNLRYLGGGAEGQSDDSEGPGDGYVKNWLHFLTVTLGFVYTL